MKTKILLFIGLFLTFLASGPSVFAQSSAKDEVVLTVSGEGKTTDEATKAALRSAISQAYGVFVSANTTLLNDDLVKDEIATITSGNIKKYDEVTNITLVNGNKSVTLKATVCISKLVSYAKSKGASTEFAGATFGMNMKMKDLNKAAERKTISDMVVIMAATLPYCYDLKCDVGEPIISEKQGAVPTYDIPLMVTFTPNKTAQSLENTFVKTLESISLTEEEKEEYERLNLDFSQFVFWKTNTERTLGKECIGTYLRNESYRLRKAMTQIVALEALNFVVVDNVGNNTSFAPKSKYDYYGQNILDVEDMEINTKEVSPIEFIYKSQKTMKVKTDDGWSPFNNRQEEFKNATFNVPQVLCFVMRIPQSDISKYSSFEVRRAYDNIMDRFVKQ